VLVPRLYRCRSGSDCFLLFCGLVGGLFINFSTISWWFVHLGHCLVVVIPGNVAGCLFLVIDCALFGCLINQSTNQWTYQSIHQVWSSSMLWCLWSSISTFVCCLVVGGVKPFDRWSCWYWISTLLTLMVALPSFHCRCSLWVLFWTRVWLSWSFKWSCWYFILCWFYGRILWLHFLIYWYPSSSSRGMRVEWCALTACNLAWSTGSSLVTYCYYVLSPTCHLGCFPM